MSLRSTIAATPVWGAALALAGIGLFCAAGFWQLSRSAEKAALHARFTAGSDVPAMRVLPPDDALGENLYRRVRVEGRYDGRRQFLLDNMVHDSRPGYQVLTPLATSAGTVMVNRGWVPAAGDRTRLPAIGVDAGRRSVSGRIAPFMEPGLRLDEPPPAEEPDWPRRLTYPSAERLAVELGEELRGYQLLLDPDEPEGFVRDWTPGGMPPERHLAYAVQWFGLAATVLAVYLVLLARHARGARRGN